MAFGQATAQQFDEQLSYFKNDLLSLYRQKAKLIAARESLRFQYLTQGKAKFNSIISAIYNQAYADKNDQAVELLEIIIGTLRTGIPMVLMDGASVSGWGANVYIFGGRHQVGFLSPISHYLTEPFGYEQDPDQRPAYQLYGEAMVSMTPERIITDFFLPYFVQVYDQQTGVYYPFAGFPPDENYVKLFLEQRYPQNAGLISQYPYVKSLLETSYPQAGGSLADLVSWIMTSLKDIVRQTQQIIKLQFTIDGAENALINFVNEYAAQTGAALNASDVLKDLFEESQKAEEIPEAIEQMVEETGAPPIEEPKSKLPWIAAAAGLFMLLRK